MAPRDMLDAEGVREVGLAAAPFPPPDTGMTGGEFAEVKLKKSIC
jgi:hypothetical protein